MQVLVTNGQSLSTITFTIKDFDSDGQITEVKETGGSKDATSDELKTSMKLFKTSQTTLISMQTLLKATKEFDFTIMTTEPTTEVTIIEFMTELTTFLITVGKSMTDSKVETLGTKLMNMKMKQKGSAAMISKLSFIISTVTTYVVQITTEITSIQKQISGSTSGGEIIIVTYEVAQQQITALTSAKTSFESVSTAITTSMGSSDKSATISAFTFFSYTNTFFITISTMSIETLKTETSTEITTSINQLITASSTGVSVSSAKFKLIFQTIIQSITIFVEIIQIQITILKSVTAGTQQPGATPAVTPAEPEQQGTKPTVPATQQPTTTQNPELMILLEQYRILKENEIAVGQSMTMIEMIRNKTVFSDMSPSMCDGSGLEDGSGMGSGPGSAPGKGPCGSGSAKKTSIILSLVKGLKTGLSSSIEETSSFSTAQTIVDALFKFKFDSFSSSDESTLGTESDELSKYLEAIKTELIVVTGKIDALGYDYSYEFYRTIQIPPCVPEPFRTLKDELLFKLTGLFANLEATESAIESVEVVIKGDLANKTVTVDNFIIILESLTAVFDLYTPCELFKVVIQEISSLLVFFSTTTENPTAAQIIILTNYLTILLQFKLEIIVQINIIQSQLSEITGSTVDPSTLDIFTIGPDGQIGPSGSGPTPPPGIKLPSEEEAEIQVVIDDLISAINYIELIIININLMITGNFPVDASATYSCSDFFELVMEFVTLLIRGEFGPPLNAAATKLLAVTSLSGECGSVTITYLRIVVVVLTEIKVNIIGAITVITQKMIISRGLIITINFETLYLLSFEEQVNILELSLQQNREACAGMDEVALALELFVESVVCGPEFATSDDIGSLIEKITELSKMSALNIEDGGLVQLATLIVDLINALTATQVNLRQCKTIEILIIIIQNTVLTFVSQISILEQRRLQITGELKFSFSIEAVFPEDDYENRIFKDKKQLEGLMLCGDFTDRSTESIQTAFAVVEPAFFNDCDGREVLKKAQRVTAMCSSEILPVEDVAENTKDLARCSSNLARPLNERELSTLEFIMISLSTFRITFSSQITIIQQRLTVLTGQTVTAADLFLNFIGPDGSLYPALPLDIGGGDPALVPVNMLVIPDEPWFTVGRELFLVKQWTEFRFAFSTMQIVIKSINSVLDIEGAIETSGYFKSGPEFLFEVLSYFTKIGQGLFTTDALYDTTFNVIKCASQVTVEVSNRLIILLNSITIGLRSFQMACGSEFIVIQQKLIQIVSISVSSMQIQGNEFTEEGTVVTYSMGTAQTPGDVTVIDARIFELRETLSMLQDVMVCIDAGIKNDFEGIVGANVKVEPGVFLKELNSVILSLSIDITYIDIDAYYKFVSFCLEFETSDRQRESLINIKSTVFSYCSMLAAEVSQSQSSKQDISPITIVETNITALDQQSTDLRIQIDTFDSLLISISVTVESCGAMGKPNSAVAYFNMVFDFYIMLVSTDVIQNDVLTSFVADLTIFQQTGIRCITGSFELVFVIVRIALTIYIEISQLVLALVLEAILDITGQCPTSYELGDWNTGEGECCCDPNDQPEEFDFVLEEPILIPPTYEEPVLIDGEEPYLINGEEPVLIPGEEPVQIPLMEEPVPLFMMEEPILINGNGSGYGEEPIVISGYGEEPIVISGYGEEPISIPMLEEPVLIGGEEPVLIGGEEPVDISGGEEPVPISFTFEEPFMITEPYEPITGPPPAIPTVPPYKPAPPKPEKKFCKCRKNATSTTPAPIPSPAPVPVPTPVPSGPSPVPTPVPSGPSPVPTPVPSGPSPVPTPGPSPVPVPTPGPSPVPVPSPVPLTSPVPMTGKPQTQTPTPAGFTPSILVTTGTSGEIPYKLTKTTPRPTGSIPFKIPKSTSTTPTTAKKGQIPFKLPKNTTPTPLLRKLAHAAKSLL